MARLPRSWPIARLLLARPFANWVRRPGKGETTCRHSMTGDGAPVLAHVDSEMRSTLGQRGDLMSGIGRSKGPRCLYWTNANSLPIVIHRHVQMDARRQRTGMAGGAFVFEFWSGSAILAKAATVDLADAAKGIFYWEIF